VPLLWGVTFLSTGTAWELDSPEIDVLIDGGDAQIKVDGHEHEADDGIGAHHAVDYLPHG